MRFSQWPSASIRTRITLWIVGVLAVILIVPGGILRYSLEATLLGSIDQELEGRGRVAIQWWSHMGMDPHAFGPPEMRSGPGPLQRKLMEKEPMFRFRPRIFDQSGRSFPPNNEDALWDRTAFIRSRKGEVVLKTIHLKGEPIRVYSMPLHRRGEVVAVMQTGYSLAEMERDVRGLARTLITMIPIALLLVGIGSALLTDRLLRPLRTITRAAEQIGAADLAQRLPIAGTDEFSQLSLTFNNMLARLEQSFEQQRRFTADASHELRTPLSAIKAHTSFALYGARSPAEYRRALEGADRSVDMMSHIVQDLLLLARSDAGQLRPQMRPVSVTEILAASIEAIQGAPHAPVETHIADDVQAVLGDKCHLTRLFTNLLSNAAHHTALTGQIVLSAHLQQGRVCLSVQDTGAGIAPEHVPHVFERFYRADEARNHKQGSTGLGLAICRCIVDAHQGSISLESVVAQGTTVRVMLPSVMSFQ